MRCYSIDCQLSNLLEAPLWMRFEGAFVVPETLPFAGKRRCDENQAIFAMPPTVCFSAYSFKPDTFSWPDGRGLTE